ncbi:hypothetical protein AKO1_003202 [Acrasis kona]|uniref:Calponin-homology (CH) domain-containing protein n=2 Tax=Acrasis kona TaxID=1008807 RepID=A0AAW2ZM87_9EUKA
MVSSLAVQRHITDNETLYFILGVTIVVNIVMLFILEMTRGRRRTIIEKPKWPPISIEREVRSIINATALGISNAPPIIHRFDSSLDDYIERYTSETERNTKELERKFISTVRKMKTNDQCLEHYMSECESLRDDNDRLTYGMYVLLEKNPYINEHVRAEALLLRKQNLDLTKVKRLLQDTLTTTKKHLTHLQCLLENQHAERKGSLRFVRDDETLKEEIRELRRQVSRLEQENKLLQSPSPVNEFDSTQHASLMETLLEEKLNSIQEKLHRSAQELIARQQLERDMHVDTKTRIEQMEQTLKDRMDHHDRGAMFKVLQQLHTIKRDRDNILLLSRTHHNNTNNDLHLLSGHMKQLINRISHDESQLNVESQQTKHQLNVLNQKYDDLMDQHQESKSTNITLTNDIHMLQDQLACYEQTNNQLQSELTFTMNTLDQVKNEKNTLQHEYDKISKHYSKVGKELERRVNRTLSLGGGTSPMGSPKSPRVQSSNHVVLSKTEQEQITSNLEKSLLNVDRLEEKNRHLNELLSREKQISSDLTALVQNNQNVNIDGVKLTLITLMSEWELGVVNSFNGLSQKLNGLEVRLCQVTAKMNTSTNHITQLNHTNQLLNHHVQHLQVEVESSQVEITKLNQHIEELIKLLQNKTSEIQIQLESQIKFGMDMLLAFNSKSINDKLSQSESRLLSLTKKLSTISTHLESAQSDDDDEESDSDDDDDDRYISSNHKPIHLTSTPATPISLRPTMNFQLDMTKLQSPPSPSQPSTPGSNSTCTPTSNSTPKLSPIKSEANRIANEQFAQLMIEVGSDPSDVRNKSIFAMMRTDRHYDINTARDATLRSQFQQSEKLYATKALQLWIERSLHLTFDPHFDFYENLMSGVMLCELFDKLFPGKINQKQVVKKHSTQFTSMDNVKLFNQAILQIGMSKQAVIDFMDLKNKENLENVLVCLALLFVQYHIVKVTNEQQQQQQPVNVPSSSLTAPTTNNYTPLRQRAKSLAIHVNQNSLNSPRNRTSLRVGSWSPVVGMSTSPTTNVSPISLDQSMDNQSYNNGGNDGSLTSREYDDMRQDAIQVQQIHEENLILTWLRDFELIDAECENQSLWMVLRGGVVLCKLMHVMFPGSIRMDRVKYKVDNDIISELNLNLFFDACKVVGLTGLDTMRFTHQDLVKNNKNVLACLLVLFERSKKPWNGPVACSPATVPTPRLKKLGSFPSPSYFEDRKSDTFVGSNNPLELVDKLIEDLKNVESSVSEKLSVRSLGISDMKDITDEQKEELTYLLSVNQKIKWLDMSNLHLSDLFVRDLAINMVSKKTGIERLDLSQNMDIGESARASLLKLLEESETLVELCLSSKKNEEWVDRFRMAERKRKQTISFVLKIL